MAKIPTNIVLRDLPNSTAMEENIQKKIDKLSLFYNHIEFCKVVVELSQKHQHQGKLFTVLIEIGVPGKHLIANHKEREDVYVAMRDTFAAMKRQLEDYVHRQRGYVKTHVPLEDNEVRE